MKKIFRIASFVLLLAVGVACSTDDVPQEPLGTYPILFRCMDETRAVATVESMKSDAQGFAVYAFFTNNAINAIESFNKNVKYTNGSWTYQHNNQALEYWIPGATYYFKAVYPTNIDYEVDNSSTAQPLTITGYDITKQYDILVAETSRDGLFVNADGEPESGSIVNLNFEHLLACVVVKIKAEVNVTINNVSLKYVPVKGSYADGLWSYSSQGNIEKDGLNKSLSSSSDEYHDVTDGGFLVFPCDIKEAKLYIKTSDKTYELPLTAPTSWVTGNRYTYTLTIKQNDILFDEPTVEEWDEENATGSVVIK